MENADLVKQIKNIFDPIAKKFGMIELPVVKHTNAEISFAYLSTGIGIEISIDLSDFFIFLLVFKSKGKKVPAGYEDGNGVPQVVYIQHALQKISIDTSKEKKELKKLGRNYLNCSAMAKILARLFEDNWDIIKSKANVIFQK